jgi:hypothetical protein
MTSTRVPMAEPAVLDPYTTVPGAFTTAREAGLVELHEGQPVRTPQGEAYRKRLANFHQRLTSLQDEEDRP